MTPSSEASELSKAFGGATVDLYGGAELQAQLSANLAANGQTTAETPPDILGDIATKAATEVVGPNWELASATRNETTKLLGEVLSSAGLSVPELSAFVEAGVDFAHLRQGFEAYQDAGMEPELVFAPVNLQLEDAKQLYSNLRQWQETKVPLPAKGQPDPLQGRRLKSPGDGDGLYITSDVVASWDSLAKQATEDTPGSTVQSPDGTIWKVLVVPTADKAAGGLTAYTSHDLSKDNLGDQASLQGIEAEDITPNQAHMPIAATLILQALHIRRDKEPIDAYTWAWNSGTFGPTDNLQAPSARWSMDYGRVNVSQSDAGYADGNLGARLPVWG